MQYKIYIIFLINPDEPSVIIHCGKSKLEMFLC